MNTPLIIKSCISVITIILVGILSSGFYVSSKVDLKGYMECLPAFQKIVSNPRYQIDNPLPLEDIRYSESALEAMIAMAAYRETYPDTPDGEFFQLVEAGLIEATKGILKSGQCWAGSEARLLAIELQQPEYSKEAKEFSDSVLTAETVINHPFVKFSEVTNNPLIPKPFIGASFYIASMIQGVHLTPL